MSSERVKVGVSLDCTGAHYNLRLGDPYMAEGWGRGFRPCFMKYLEKELK